MAKNSFLRKLGSTMYGAAEGILDAGTFGLSDNLTDTLWTDVVNKGGANNLNQFRGAGNMAGAVGAGFLTGNISGSIEEGLEGFGYLAANSQNEQFQKAEKFANMAAQLSGFAGGANNLTGIGTKMYGLAGNPVVSQPVNQVSSLLSSIPKMPSTNVPKDVVYGNRQSTNYADGGPINPRLGSVFIPAMNPQQFQTMLNSSQPRALTKEEMLARVNRPQQNVQESTRNVSSKLVTPEQRAEAFYNSEAEQRKRRLADAEAANKEDLITSDNWQQLLMRQSQATGDKFHSDYIPDWLNPLVGIGDMASGLGAAPYNIQQGNYGSAALGVASPLAVGALGSFGANTTGQFLGNVFNPIPISTPQALNAVKNAAIKTGQLTKTAVQNLPRNLEAVERNITINLLNSKPAIAARNRVINKLINETKVKGSIFDKKNLELLKKYNTIEGLEGRIKGYVPTVLDLQHTSPGQGKLRDYLRRRYSNADNLDRPSNFEFTSTDNKFHANTVRFPTEDTPGEFSGYTFGSAMVKPDRVAAGKTAKLLIDLAENAPGAWRFNPGSLSGDSFTLWSNILKKRQDLNKFGVDVYGFTELNRWGVDSKLAQAFYKARNTRDVNDINAVNDIVIDLTNPVLSKYNVPNSSDVIKELNEITKSGDIGIYPSMSLIKRYMQGGMIKRADGSYSRRGLWDNIRANRGSGKKPTKQMLEQERKIKAKK
jgi:hypothetical protein